MSAANSTITESSLSSKLPPPALSQNSITPLISAPALPFASSSPQNPAIAPADCARSIRRAGDDMKSTPFVPVGVSAPPPAGDEAGGGPRMGTQNTLERDRLRASVATSRHSLLVGVRQTTLPTSPHDLTNDPPGMKDKSSVHDPSSSAAAAARP